VPKSFTAVYLISGENLNALPVRDISPAVDFYRTALGFEVLSQDDIQAVVASTGATTVPVNFAIVEKKSMPSISTPPKVTAENEWIAEWRFTAKTCSGVSLRSLMDVMGEPISVRA
jgi:hypothetical protein